MPYFGGIEITGMLFYDEDEKRKCNFCKKYSVNMLRIIYKSYWKPRIANETRATNICVKCLHSKCEKWHWKR